MRAMVAPRRSGDSADGPVVRLGTGPPAHDRHAAWLRELDHQLPILYGDDGPFRNCAASGDLGEHRHRSTPEMPAQSAPENWWSWWA